jgi:hypothetical protein
MDRLSEAQRNLLGWLLEQYRGTEAWIAATPAPQRERVREWNLFWGVRIGRLEAGTSRSESASTSRSLKRLEDRGLVIRHNINADPEDGRVQHRTTSVTFTEAGRKLAELLDSS